VFAPPALWDRHTLSLAIPFCTDFNEPDALI